MAITQFSTGYGSISSDIQNLISNKISLLDEYILMQTGEYEYSALVKNVASKEVKQYTIRRSSSGYNNYYTLSVNDVDDFKYTVSNEFYVYSNIGYGKSLNLSVYDGVIAFSLCILCCLSMFAVIFKGALFKCLKRRKR